MNAKNEIAPFLQLGIYRVWKYIVAGLSFLTALYYALVAAFQNSASIVGLPPPASEFCQQISDRTRVCSRSDLFAFQVCSGMAFLVCGTMGFYQWHISRRPHKSIPQTPEGRIFGYLREAEVLAALNLTFQIWDFFISLTIREHCTPIMMTHHFLAATVGFLGLQYQLMLYYSPFFMGISEVSSIFLVFTDLSRYFPPVKESSFDFMISSVIGPIFVVSFIIYRVILWWPVSFRLFHDVTAVLRSGMVTKLRPGKAWILFLFIAINIPLGLLQLYWLTLILEVVRKAALGEES